MNPTQSDHLTLRRFNGDEIYPVHRADWNLYRDESRSSWNLWINVDAGFAIIQQEDTKALNGQPKWEINCTSDNVEPPIIEVGYRCVIPKGYVNLPDVDRHTNFYYCSHEDTDDNVIEVVAVNGDNLRLRLSGTTIDVNYYDDSKPRTILHFEGWFAHNPDGRRTIA